ncbi:MAG: cation diffusion facilitator family transporter [Bacteroidetes bacterium]|nr:cation diffusion facilitator family transporter [Bacteroidota bacterium]MBU1372120.1 cation diffusion facilitator family transporter [Bacteroidota bacterium]MBU1484041.1 cation diffusion facilitator family transporter [Bacteroidota bacterium]MBU1761113.1 cation diffusion facilitator family transporter [Bacteroidota bacterium]MBU2267195.1 cation diffusion facilitator family transporter [Bacteroidota bacterium]
MAHQHQHSVKHNNAFKFGIILNILFVVVEVIYGFKANSSALLADAGHNLVDVLSLILAWVATYLATKKPNGNFTYGYRKSTILSSLINGLFLMLSAAAFIAYEAFDKLINGASVEGAIVIIVALVGVAINTATALLFMKGQEDDLNIKGAFLHMAADAGVSLGVAIGGAIILYTGLNWIDPVLGILIVAFIIYTTWSLLRESVFLALDAAPEKFDVENIEQAILSHPNVLRIHDLHVWALSTSQNALSVHVVSDLNTPDQLLEELNKIIKKQFNISHNTIQIEKSTAHLHCDCSHESITSHDHAH